MLIVCGTAKHFDRDPETNEVLWFSAPPVNAPRPPQPKHSLTYLHFLAMKRKEGQTVGGDGDGGENGEDKESETKRCKFTAQPSMRERLGMLLAEIPLPTSD